MTHVHVCLLTIGSALGARAMSFHYISRDLEGFLHIPGHQISELFYTITVRKEHRIFHNHG